MFRRPWIFAAAALAVLLCVRQTRAFAQQSDSTQTPTSPAKPDEIDILGRPAETPVAPSTPSLPKVKIPNFTSCSIAELQKKVPELAHLKVAQDQAQLAALLDGIGARTIEIARKTPNLISHEAVVSEQGHIARRQNFSYLVLQHALGPGSLVLDEFRVDMASGEKFQTEEIEKAIAAKSQDSASSPPQLHSLDRLVPESDGPPLSQGFVNAWVYFYPPNRPQAEFRYLGDQKMDGHQTRVVAFAQTPGSVRMPARIGYANKTFPIFLQGVAWVDVTDFRIVRLQTDLLLPPPGVPLHQITADIQFAETHIAEMASPLWLPRQVVVTTSLGGTTRIERHTYSGFRLFRAKSKVLLNP
ncbi:MAG TPA: hypothetical protein VE377_22350 [Candidatus Dormibacteraeota bacterium]|nr:hypothetical protein [Candidatus Dormibacteraeota bacterium]